VVELASFKCQTCLPGICEDVYTTLKPNRLKPNGLNPNGLNPNGLNPNRILKASRCSPLSPFESRAFPEMELQTEVGFEKKECDGSLKLYPLTKNAGEVVVSLSTCIFQQIADNIKVCRNSVTLVRLCTTDACTPLMPQSGGDRKVIVTALYCVKLFRHFDFYDIKTPKTPIPYQKLNNKTIYFSLAGLLVNKTSPPANITYGPFLVQCFDKYMYFTILTDLAISFKDMLLRLSVLEVDNAAMTLLDMKKDEAGSSPAPVERQAQTQKRSRNVFP